MGFWKGSPSKLELKVSDGKAHLSWILPDADFEEIIVELWQRSSKVGNYR